MSEIKPLEPFYKALDGMQWSIFSTLLEMVDNNWTINKTTTKFASYAPGINQAQYSLTWPANHHTCIPAIRHGQGHRIILATMYSCN